MNPGWRITLLRGVCQRLGVRFTPLILWVSVADQRLTVIRQRPKELWLEPALRCSTSRFGVGSEPGSRRTPLGLHRVAAKIGGGWPVGTVFEARRPVGFTWKGRPLAPITTRILWLEGLEPGRNRGAGVDTRERFIYIHGTGEEWLLGRPASSGCVHLAARDLMPLYERCPVGTLVWITK